MGRLFGTDGVRGIANTELTCELAFQLGRAGAYVLTKEANYTPRILVAMDTRISGDMLDSALTAGICSVGAQAVSAGIIPTPAVAYLVRKYGLDAGVMISASHNPVEYNGIKFFNHEGYKLSDALEEEIENIILNQKNILPTPTGNHVGAKSFITSALDDYVFFLSKSTDQHFKHLTVALDCANGAAYSAAPMVLQKLGAKVKIIHNDPDGTNINKACGSTHMEDLTTLVKETRADIGFAFDGDADRCLAVDENGNLMDGDKILAICGLDMDTSGTLKNHTIVGTVMSNLGLNIMAQKHNLRVAQTDVGDRYVLEHMMAHGHNLGGEQSGHIIFSDYNTTGDGILTAIQMLSILKRSGKKASELAEVMEVMPQVLVNARVDNAKKNLYMDVPEIQDAITQLENTFAQEGRVLIRTSGTEPLVRVMIEGKNEEKIQQEAKKLALLIEEKLG